MTDYETQKLLSQLSEKEKEILTNGINYAAAQILLKIMPNNSFIKNLVDIKRY